MTPNITKLGTIASDSAALLNRERAAIAKEFFIYKRLFLKLMFTLEKAVQCRSAASVPMRLSIYYDSLKVSKSKCQIMWRKWRGGNGGPF